MDENAEDPGAEAIERAGRVTLMAASAAGCRLAEVLRERAEERTSAERADGERLQQRWSSERAVAKAELPIVYQSWMNDASPQQAARAGSTASAWAQVDHEFAWEADVLRERIYQRWGVNVDPAAGTVSGEPPMPRWRRRGASMVNATSMRSRWAPSQVAKVRNWPHSIE